MFYNIIKRNHILFILFLCLATLSVLENAFSWNTFFVFFLVFFLTAVIYNTIPTEINLRLVDFTVFLMSIFYTILVFNFIMFLGGMGIIFVVLFVLVVVIFLLLNQTERIKVLK